MSKLNLHRVLFCLLLSAARLGEEAVFPHKMRDGRGITRGLCHFIKAGTWGKRHSTMARFDCDVILDVRDPAMKMNDVWHRPDAYFKQGLSAAQRRRITDANRTLLAEGM